MKKDNSGYHGERKYYKINQVNVPKKKESILKFSGEEK
jgi:hypothetical protein